MSPGLNLPPSSSPSQSIQESYLPLAASGNPYSSLKPSSGVEECKASSLGPGAWWNHKGFCACHHRSLFFSSPHGPSLACLLPVLCLFSWFDAGERLNPTGCPPPNLLSHQPPEAGMITAPSRPSRLALLLLVGSLPLSLALLRRPPLPANEDPIPPSAGGQRVQRLGYRGGSHHVLQQQRGQR